MVAWAGAERLALGDHDGFEVAAKARWPLDSSDMGLGHAA
jgi:N6-L-threonylcarbamoyladenine synthase